jgi:broad specificity phosphatase PhoE
MLCMGTLYLVRHGQASFGSANYDQLSPLGTQQCAALGEWMHTRGLRFDGVIRGTLQRHEQSLHAMADVMPGLPQAIEWPGLNEYDSEAVVRAVHSGPLEPARTPDDARNHFRWLRTGLLKWMAGEVKPAGMPDWNSFSRGVASALELARSRFEGDVLLISSGGPISTAVGQVLHIPPAGVVELNLRLRNSALTEMVTTSKGHALLSFNALPHLDRPERAGWVTYA